MNRLRSFLLALVASAALACVINVGEDNCSACDNAPRCHSHLDADGGCSCDPGHQWKNPGNDNDFECEKIPPKPGTAQCVEDNSYMMGDSCFCRAGYIWCSTDPMDLTCCVDENQASAGGTDTDGDTDDTDTDDSDGRVLELPDCTPELEGQLGCTSADPDAPETTMQCVGGQWVEFGQDMQCQMQGDDFAYGCVLMDQAVEVLCGKGPGSQCTDEDLACIDDVTLHICLFGRLSARNCMMWCEGPEGGSCVANDCECLE